MNRQFSHARPGFAPVWFALLAALAPASALAQAADKYQTLQVPGERFISSQRLEIRKILSGGEPLQGNEAKFKDFFLKGVFAEMASANKLNEVGDLRRNFLRVYVRSAKLPQAQAAYDRLNQLAVKAMTIFIAGNYHPAVRYNAVLLLGQLDAKPGSEFGLDKAPPVPLPAALPILIKAYEAGSLPDMVKIGAILGIQRHLKYRNDIPKDQLAAIAGDMYKLAVEAAPPAGRTKEGHEWMRRQAIETLGILGQPGGNNEVLAALTKIIGDGQQSLATRCEAAATLKQLKFKADAKAPVDQLVAALEQLAAGIGQFEQAQLALHQARRLPIYLQIPIYPGAAGMAGGMSYGGPGMYPPSAPMPTPTPEPRSTTRNRRSRNNPEYPGGPSGPGMAEGGYGPSEEVEPVKQPDPVVIPPAPFPSRRRLAARLVAVLNGLEVAEKLNPAKQPGAAALKKRLATVLKALEDLETPEEWQLADKLLAAELPKYMALLTPPQAAPQGPPQNPAPGAPAAAPKANEVPLNEILGAAP